MPEGDPLKNKAKERALSILENLTGKNVSAEILEDIEILKTYLKLAKYQGWVSDMNFLILEKEYDQIKNQISVTKPVKKEVLPKKENTDVQRLSATDVGRLEGRGLARQEKILDILSKREKTQVSDIIKELPNITKRTIRRDLDDLLKEGKVMRMGEFNQIFYQIS